MFIKLALVIIGSATLVAAQGTVCVYTSHNHQVQYVCTPHTTTRYSMCVHLTQPPGTVCVYTSHNHKVQYVCTPQTTTRYSMCVHLTQPPGTVCVYTSHNHQVRYVCTPHTTVMYSIQSHLTWFTGYTGVCRWIHVCTCVCTYTNRQLSVCICGSDPML